LQSVGVRPRPYPPMSGSNPSQGFGFIAVRRGTAPSVPSQEKFQSLTRIWFCCSLSGYGPVRTLLREVPIPRRDLVSLQSVGVRPRPYPPTRGFNPLQGFGFVAVSIGCTASTQGICFNPLQGFGFVAVGGTGGLGTMVNCFNPLQGFGFVAVRGRPHRQRWSTVSIPCRDLVSLQSKRI
jgi:cold shock CspA family protein